LDELAKTPDEFDLNVPAAAIDEVFGLPSFIVQLSDIDIAVTYTFDSNVSVSRITSLFYNGEGFAVDWESNNGLEFVGFINTLSTQQDVVVLKCERNFQTREATLQQMIVYRDMEPLNRTPLILKDLATIHEYQQELVPFIGDELVTFEELYWRTANIVYEVSKQADEWIGAEVPVSFLNITESFEDAATDEKTYSVSTKIKQPYVLQTIKFNYPVAFSNPINCFVDTADEMYHSRVFVSEDSDCVGILATAANSCLIIRVSAREQKINKIEVVSINFPFRIPIDVAIPISVVVGELNLPEFDAIPIGEDIASVASCYMNKPYVKGNVVHDMAVTTVQEESLPFNGLEVFEVQLGKSTMSHNDINSDAISWLCFSYPFPDLCIEPKKSYRLRISYIINGNPHTRQQKLRVSNVNSDIILSFPLDDLKNFMVCLSRVESDRFIVSAVWVQTTEERAPQPVVIDWSKYL